MKEKKEECLRWVNTNDRQPKKTGYYFTCTDDSGHPQCVGLTYFDAEKDGGVWWDDEDDCIAAVDYWMPIPGFDE